MNYVIGLASFAIMVAKAVAFTIVAFAVILAVVVAVDVYKEKYA